jgi:hypothetical protein
VGSSLILVANASKLPLLATICVLLCVPSTSGNFQSPTQTPTQFSTQSPTQAEPASPALTPQQIIQRIDDVVLSRAKAISTFTVQEHYALYRNGEANPSAEETIRTVYNRATGKQYTPIAQSGSSLLRSAVIDKVLAGEKDANLPANREATWITSHNYEMQPHPGTAEIDGRQCILVDLKPMRKTPHLIDGKIWIDAAAFTVVRLEGSPSESPSFFAGDTTLFRDYTDIDGFSMAVHAEAHSHNFLFGSTVLKIDYTGYSIQTDPLPPSGK